VEVFGYRVASDLIQSKGRFLGCVETTTVESQVEKGLEGGGESISSGSFAALRMTAETSKGKGEGVLRPGRDLGREADFSAPLLTKA
jgi:hypothetical protein